MNFGDTREVQRKLRRMNRKGAVVRYTFAYDEGCVWDFPCESIYVVNVIENAFDGKVDKIISLFWIEGCCDFIMHSGQYGGNNSTRYFSMKDIKVVKLVNDEKDGEQWHKIKATRISYDDLSKGLWVDGEVEITIAFPEYTSKEMYDKIQDWKKDRSKRHKYYELGERRIVEKYVPNYKYTLS